MQFWNKNPCTVETNTIHSEGNLKIATTPNPTINESKPTPADNSSKLQCLDVFSGSGGISLALTPYCRTAAYCDIDPNARSILSARMQDGRLETAPIFESIQAISPESLACAGVCARDINIVAGGFPCQDVSVAGRQMGLVSNTRSSLWKEIVRVARFCGDGGAEWIFLENVTGIVGLKENGIGAVVSELHREGYDLRWTTLSCGDLKAIHSRERWWCLCKKSNAPNPTDIRPAETPQFHDTKPDYVHELLRRSDKQGRQACTSWSPELPAFRVYHGLCSRLDENNRIRCGIVGNAVSPPVARLAFETLLGLQYLGSQKLYDALDDKKIRRNTQNFFSDEHLMSDEVSHKKEVDKQKSPKKENNSPIPKKKEKKKKKIPKSYIRINKKLMEEYEKEADFLQEDLPYGWVVEVEIKYISKTIGRQSFAFFSPCGRKFKHLASVQKFLNRM